MLTVADMGEGGVKNGQKSADILYGRPLCMYEYRFVCICHSAVDRFLKPGKRSGENMMKIILQM